MILAAEYWRRYGTAAVSLLAGALVLWLALHSYGSDWFISHTHADILFTAVHRFGEFPFYSFAFGGGYYFLQDPQSNLYSPANPLVLLAGPTIGLRLAEGLWGVVGCYGFIAWMRRHVSEVAAQFGALAWCVSLGVFWRVTVGNDMFLWHLGLPILLLLIEDVVSKRTWRTAVALGLAVGLFLLGPTFHTFTYLFVPVLPIFGVLALILERPGPAALGRIALLLLAAFALALVIASPKLACWVKFPMGRPTPDPGVPALKDALGALVNYTYTEWFKVTMGKPPPRARYYYWGIEESAVALPPPAAILMPLGAAAGLYVRKYRPYAIFALLIVALGLTVTACAPLWKLFRELTNGNFRVAPRYLAVAWFGMAILATLGAEALFTRWLRAQAALAGLFFTGVVASALWWVYAAGRVEVRQFNDTVVPEIINPFTTAKEEYEKVSRINGFNEIVFFSEHAPFREFLEGHGLTNGFLVVGNDYDRRRWFNKRPQPVVTGLAPSDVIVQHTRIKLRNVPADASLSLRLLEPRFGLDVQSVPADAKVSLEWNPRGLVLKNTSQRAIERLVLRPKLPISVAWFVLSAGALLAACAALTYPRWTRRPAVLRRFTFSV
ncbi:MAG: hypothetical protein ACOY0T_13140 [Myxococcota bacterium]